MLERIRQKAVYADGWMFIFSDGVFLTNKLVMRVLERADCLMPLGRLDGNVCVPKGLVGRNFRQGLIDMALANRVSYPWNRKVWMLEQERMNAVNRDLLLNRPELWVESRPAGGEIRPAHESDLPTSNVSWTAEG